VGVELTLDCVRWRRAGRTSTSRIVWQEKSAAAARQGPHGVEIPARFEIPYDLEPTGPSGPWGDQVAWHLTARSADASFQALFSLPVFRTAASDATRTCEALEAREGAQFAGSSLPAGPYAFPGRRHLPAAMAFSLFGLASLALAVFLWLGPWP